jgi:hypothetical protein
MAGEEIMARAVASPPASVSAVIAFVVIRLSFLKVAFRCMDAGSRYLVPIAGPTCGSTGFFAPYGVTVTVFTAMCRRFWPAFNIP